VFLLQIDSKSFPLAEHFEQVDIIKNIRQVGFAIRESELPTGTTYESLVNELTTTKPATVYVVNSNNGSTVLSYTGFVRFELLRQLGETGEIRLQFQIYYQ